MRAVSRDRSRSRDRSGWRDGSVWPRASRSRCVPSSRSWTWRVHSGTRESCRALSGATCADAELVAGQPVGHPEADEAFDGLPRAPAPCERRTQAERVAELTQVDTAGSRLRHNTGRRRRTSRAKGPMTPAPDLFDVGGHRERIRPVALSGWGGAPRGWPAPWAFHAPLGPPAPPIPRPVFVVADVSWAGDDEVNGHRLGRPVAVSGGTTR
jgi:hypothetical protein